MQKFYEHHYETFLIYLWFSTFFSVWTIFLKNI